MTTFTKLTRPASFLLAAILGFTLGACGHSQVRIERVCKKYCERVVDCNDNADFDNCFDDCVETANNCDSDSDVEDALDVLTDCAEESCNQILACSVDAWFECAV